MVVAWIAQVVLAAIHKGSEITASYQTGMSVEEYVMHRCQDREWAFTEQINSLKRELALLEPEYRSQIDSYIKETDILKRIIRDLRYELEQNISKIQQERSRGIQLETNNRVLEDRLETVKTEMEQFVSRLATMQSYLDHNHTKLAEIQQVLEERQTEITELTETKIKLEANISACQVSLKNSSDENKIKEKRLEKVIQEKLILQDELKQQINLTNKAAAEVQIANEKHQNQTKDIERITEKYQIELNRSQEAVSNCTTNNTRLRLQNDEEVRKCKLEIDEWNTRCERERTNLENLLANCETSRRDMLETHKQAITAEQVACKDQIQIKQVLISELEAKLNQTLEKQADLEKAHRSLAQSAQTCNTQPSNSTINREDTRKQQEPTHNQQDEQTQAHQQQEQPKQQQPHRIAPGASAADNRDADTDETTKTTTHATDETAAISTTTTNETNTTERTETGRSADRKVAAGEGREQVVSVSEPVRRRSPRVVFGSPSKVAQAVDEQGRLG